MIDINGLITEFKNIDIDTTIEVNSDLDYIFNVAMDDLTKEELNIIHKYADIEAIKIHENVRHFQIYIKEKSKGA